MTHPEEPAGQAKTPFSLLGELKSHPRGLMVLFFAEMWERFSYYGMRALLILYLTKELLMTDEMGNSIFGTYVALVYATPIFGGMLADRLLGFRRAVILGGVMMALGHLAMAFEPLLYWALGLLIVGNGLFKPNISSIVGRLYGEGDPRRDAGFAIFYMGINLGAMLSPIVCGIIGAKYGWHWGFGLAGVGMVLGLINFVWGSKSLGELGRPPEPEALRKKLLPGLNVEWAVYFTAFASVVLAWFLVRQFELVGKLLNGTGVIVLTGLLFYAIFRCDRVDRDRLFVVIFLTVLSIVFWSFFEQAGNSITLFTDRNVDRHVFGREIPTPVFQSVNAFFIVLLAPFFSIAWARLARRGVDPSIPMKFGMGIIQLGLGFGALYYGVTLAGEDGMVALIWLVLGYFLHTTGELCLSPVGLSAVTKLSPAKIVGLMMGVWFLAASYASHLGARVAKLMSIPEVDGEAATEVSSAQTVTVYGTVFGQIALVAIGVGIVAILLTPLVKRGLHGVR